MLVLSRKKNERILIGSSIEIIVTKVHGNTVKLGINAPKDVPVHREEVHQQIELESQRLVPNEGVCYSI